MPCLHRLRAAVHLSAAALMNPQFSIYIASKGRAASRLTMRHLDAMRVPHKVIVEQAEHSVLTVAVTRKMCKTDLTKLCAGIVPGTGGIRACIKSHMAEVSDPCKDAMSRAPAGRKILGHEDL